MSEQTSSDQASVILAYDGMDATHHRIDMRRFGRALIGFDHIITNGVIALSERRIAHPRERLSFDVVVAEPTKGSVEALGALMAAYSGSQGNLPFIIQLISEAFPDLLWHWLSWVFKSLGGRPKEADSHFEKLMEFTGRMHKDSLVDRERERAFLLEVLKTLRPYARDVAVPVGTSSNVLKFRQPGTSKTTELGVAEAEAVRSKDAVEVGDPEVMRIRIDGLTKHTTRGLIELHDQPGRYIPVEIRDPLFEQIPNPYISAMNSAAEIEVTAVPSYKNGSLSKIYVMGLLDKAA